MSMHLEFTDEQIQRIKFVIDQKDETDCAINRSFNTVWLADNETEFRFGFLGRYKLVISRVCFAHRRQGILSDILGILKSICLENDVHNITMQSVETKEMIAFCVKNGFIPDKYSTFQDEEGDIYGDYILKI